MKPIFLTAPTAFGLCTLLMGCNEPLGNQTIEDALGVWHAPAYGNVYVISQEAMASYTMQQFHLSSEYCVPGVRKENLSLAVLSEQLRPSKNGNQLEVIEPGQAHVPGVLHDRLENLPALCSDGLQPIKGQPGYHFNPELDFELFWQTLNEHYLDFQLSGTDWGAVYELGIQALPDIEDEEDLFELFSYMIEPLEDGHNILLRGDLSLGARALLASGETEDVYSISRKPDLEDRLVAEFLELNDLASIETEQVLEAAEEYVEAELELTFGNIASYSHSDIKSLYDEAFVWFTTDENIGYLMINSMSNYGDALFDVKTDASLAADAIDQVLSDFRDVDSLIIDLRINDGGDDEVSARLLQRFLPSPTLAYSKQARLGNDRTPLAEVYLSPAGPNQYLGPIVVLTSSATVSAGEIFTLGIRDLPNVTIIGEATAGELSNILEKRVTSDIAFGLSNEFYFSAKGVWFERSGIPVNIEVPFATKDQRQMMIDLGIETAIDNLM